MPAPDPHLAMLGAARAAGELLAGHAEPLTLWLGAGASVSSGAPTTPQALAAFRSLLEGRSIDNPASITELPGDITAFERKRTLEPLFEGFVPYIGYRLAAGLARRRSVRVLTTNWDDGTEQAARRLGLDVLSFDLLKMTAGDWEACAEAAAGTVVVVHVHGTLDDPRYSHASTLTFREPDESRMRDVFLKHTTLVLGASLSGDDTDISRLLLSAWGQREADVSAIRQVLYMGRGAPGAGEGAPAAALANRDSARNVLIDPYADFDRIMLAVAEGALGVRWRTDVARSLVLPDKDELVLPSPELVRSALDERVVVLVGEPEIGKTTAAYLLAHVDVLCHGASGVEVADGGREGLAVVGSPTAGPVVLEDPFGASDDYEPTPSLLDRLEVLARERPEPFGHPRDRLVVTTRRGNWAAAVGDHGTRPALPGVVECPTDDWYDDRTLERLAGAVAEVRARVRELATPRRVRDALEGRMVTRDPHLDHVQALRSDPVAAVLVALVRLQEIVDDPQSARSLALLAGASDNFVDAVLTRAGWALERFDLDGADYLRLRRPPHIDAANVLLAEAVAGEGPVATALTPLTSTIPWVAAAMKGFLLLAGVSRGSALGMHDTPGGDLAPFLPALFAKSGNAAVVTPERYAALDRWGVVELALELVRLWPDVRGKAGASALLDMIFDDAERQGTYAIAETVLYFGDSADREIVDRLAARCWDLLDPGRGRFEEAIKVFDGLLWKRPPAGVGAPQWVRRLFAAVSPDLPERGALLAACAQHPRSVDLLQEIGERHPLAGQGPRLSDEQAAHAARMIGWHFAHQSRNRSVAIRHHAVDLPALRRRRTPEHQPDTHGAGDLVQALSRHPAYAGYGVLLGVTLGCTDGIAVDDYLLAEAVRSLGSPDTPVMLAAITFELPEQTQREIRRHLGQAEWRRELLSLLLNGADLGGERLAPPRFRYASSATSVLSRLRVHVRPLEELGGLPFDELPAALAAARSAAAELYDIPEHWVDEAIAAILAGDVDALSARFRQGPDAPAEDGLARRLGGYAELLRDTSQGELM